ncbi:MAG: GNAT family N-acetyltransferase, partial [bacterium]
SSAEHFFISVKNEKTGGLLGFVSFLIIPEYAVGDVKCIALAVKPEEQNRGLGKLLMSSIYKIIPDLKRIFLCTRTTNIIAQKAYYNWGFVKYLVDVDINPVFEEHDYTFNLNHWIFMEYKTDQAMYLQKTAATLTDLFPEK